MKSQDGDAEWLGVDSGSVHTRIARSGAVSRLACGDRASALRSVLAGQDAARLVVAVPDAWSESGPDGALERESLRRTVLELTGFALHSVVESSLAVTACAVSSGLVERSCAVLDVGAAGVTAAWCEVEGTTVRLVRSTTVPCAPLEAALGTPREDLHAALTQFHERGNHALNAALRLSRYRRTPAYRVAGSWLTAESVINAFEPFVTAIRATVTELLPLPGPILLAGGFARFPPTAPAVREAAGSSPVVMSGDAAARGALDLARGVVDAPRPSGRLLVDRVVNGLLEVDDLPLDSGPVVEVPAGLHATVRQGALAGVTPGMAEGRYRVAWWPNRGDLGTVVLRPLDGGHPISYPLVEAP